MSNRAFVINWCQTVCHQLPWGHTDLCPCPSPKCVSSDLEQLRKIRRRSPHDDTEAFTVFLRSDVEAKLVVFLTNQDLKDKPMAAGVLIFYPHYFSLCVTFRALDVWGSQEALAREKNLRREVEREYQESRSILCKLWLLSTIHLKGKFTQNLCFLQNMQNSTTVQLVSNFWTLRFACMLIFFLYVCSRFHPCRYFPKSTVIEGIQRFLGKHKGEDRCMFAHIDVSFAVVERHHLYHLCVSTCVQFLGKTYLTKSMKDNPNDYLKQ